MWWNKNDDVRFTAVKVSRPPWWKAAGSRWNRSSRRGSVVTLTAAGLVALCGFCALGVDYGRAVLVKNQLQRGCDAAALAAVRWLPLDPAGAKQAAVYYAARNKVTVDPNQIQITNNVRIRVPATARVTYFFAPVIKIVNGPVAAQATAALQQRSSFVPSQLVPIGITPSTVEQYKNGSPVVLEGIRMNKDSLGIRDFVLFDLSSSGGKSPSQMEGQLQWGSAFNEPTSIGDSETTLNASDVAQSSHFEAGMQTRFTAAKGAPWYDTGRSFTKIPPGSPLLVMMIVTPEAQAINGNNAAPVLAFQPTYIEAMTVTKGTMRLRVRLLPPNTNIGGGVWTDVSPNDPVAVKVATARLVE